MYIDAANEREESMKEYGFGADLGGTTCKLGLFRTDGTLLEKWEIPTDTGNSGENILRDIAAAVHAKMVEKSLTKEEVEGLGIGVPGPVSKDGVVNRAVNLGWGVTPVAQQLQELSGLKVRVANDANVAALGESWMGSGKGFDSIVMVTLGTGIGGGIVIDGRILTGADGAAGEIGHTTINEQELEACGCGRFGCLEQYASATGIARFARKMLAANNEASRLRQIGGQELTAKDVFDAAKEGDRIANEVVEEVCKMLAAALANVCVVVNPEAVLIGGGVSKAGQILLDAIEEPFRSMAFHACQDTKILLASLGNDAGIYGGVRLILD